MQTQHVHCARRLLQRILSAASTARSAAERTDNKARGIQDADAARILPPGLLRRMVATASTAVLQSGRNTKHVALSLQTPHVSRACVS